MAQPAADHPPGGVDLGASVCERAMVERLQVVSQPEQEAQLVQIEVQPGQDRAPVTREAGLHDGLVDIERAALNPVGEGVADTGGEARGLPEEPSYEALPVNEELRHINRHRPPLPPRPGGRRQAFRTWPHRSR